MENEHWFAIKDTLKWNSDWSDADRALITQEIIRLGVGYFASKRAFDRTRSLIAYNLEGKAVFKLYPGYIAFYPAYGPRYARPGAEGNGTKWHPLTCFKATRASWT